MWQIDGTLTGSMTLGQSTPGSNNPASPFEAI